MRFKVTYTRTMILTKIFDAPEVTSEVGADNVARDEMSYLLDMDFEEVRTDYRIELLTTNIGEGYRGQLKKEQTDIP